MNFYEIFSRNLSRALQQTTISGSSGSQEPLATRFHAMCQDLLSIRERACRLFFVGNGGSASVAGHMAMDFTRHGMVADALSDSPSLTAIANDDGYENVYSRQLHMKARSGDGLIAISSSGASPSIINACIAMKNFAGPIITLTAMQETNAVRSLGAWNVYVPVMSYGLAEVSHHAICHSMLDWCATQIHG